MELFEFLKKTSESRKPQTLETRHHATTKFETVTIFSQEKKNMQSSSSVSLFSFDTKKKKKKKGRNQKRFSSNRKTSNGSQSETPFSFDEKSLLETPDTAFSFDNSFDKETSDTTFSFDEETSGTTFSFHEKDRESQDEKSQSPIENVSSTFGSISISQETDNMEKKESITYFTGLLSLSDTLKSIAIRFKDLTTSELKSEIKQSVLCMDAKEKSFLGRLSMCLQDSVKCDETISEWIPHKKLAKMKAESVRRKIARYKGMDDAAVSNRTVKLSTRREKISRQHVKQEFKEVFLKSTILSGQGIELDSIKDKLIRKYVQGSFFDVRYIASDDYDNLGCVEKRFLACVYYTLFFFAL